MPAYAVEYVTAALRASTSSSWTATGSPATIRGVGRPAAAAAAVTLGTTWVSTAFGGAIHRTVPSASSPATLSSLGPNAETSTGTGCGGATARPVVCAVQSSPSRSTGSPRSSGARMRRYSSVLRPGWSYDSPNTSRIRGSWDGPIPSVKPGRPIASTTDAARLACSSGWHG